MAENSRFSRRQLMQGGAASVALGAMALSNAAMPTRQASNPCVLDGLQPVVLTISGPGVQANRGQPQAVTDHMLLNHGYRFDSAWSCGLDALNSLEQQSIQTPLEYDESEHHLQGPLLEHVLQAAGLDIAQTIAQRQQLTLQGVNGYRAQISLAQALRWKMLIATHLDKAPLAVGGLGPLWAIFATQHIDELSQLPIKQRFPAAVWGLYYLELSPSPA